MHVDHLARITTHDRRRYVPQIAGEDDHVGARTAQSCVEPGVALACRPCDDLGGDAPRAGALQRTGVHPVARHEHDVSRPPVSQAVEVLQNRLQVRSRAGSEHRDARASHRRGKYVDEVRGSRFEV